MKENLAERFGISQPACSSIFTTRIKFLGTMLGDALLVWLPRNVL